MIFVIGVVFLFVAVSIYFFFRSERLQAELRVAKKESSNARKSAKAMADNLALVAAKQEEFLKFRLQKLQIEIDKNKLPLDKEVKFLIPLVNNYAAIFRASMTSNAQMKPTIEKCCESLNKGLYKGLVTYINGKEAHIRKMWSANNVNGFASIVEALLTELVDGCEHVAESKQAIPA